MAIEFKGLTDDYFSEYFLSLLRESLLSQSEESEEFINGFFNNLNLITTDLFVMFKEFKDDKENEQVQKKTKFFLTVA